MAQWQPQKAILLAGFSGTIGPMGMSRFSHDEHTHRRFFPFSRTLDVYNFNLLAMVVCPSDKGKFLKRARW